MNKEILKILEEVHHVIKTYLNYSASINYIQNSLYWHWLNIYWNWSEYVSESIKWRMHTTHKKKWIVSYTRTKRLYELYQTDLVKIATKQNIKILSISLHELIIFQNTLGQYQSESKKQLLLETQLFIFYQRIPQTIPVW